jgi:hydrogenase maturation protein HypF
MRIFEMCDECRAEYEDPLNRRFHAQPNACPKCGPQLELWDPKGEVLAERHEVLLEAAEAIRRGEILALKGLGGFHLIVDARDDEAVNRLRERKRREEKPFALMYPSLELVKEHCRLSKLEERLLTSPEAPIVLLRRKGPADIAPSVAPRNPYLGVMLPYTPLHHILLAELGFPVVATSGNLSDEPICTSEDEALKRLGGIADLFLVHNRPIARHVDDSVVCVVLDRELVLRRARGYAPLPIHLKGELPQVLAVGAHLKNTIAVSVGREVFISQHIGDLETAEAFEAFKRVIESFQKLYELEPELVVCDAHPDYLSTGHAERMGLKLRRVQHHWAHVLSCMAENELEGPVLGISWDGTGYGLDGTVWGGEFLAADLKRFERIAHFRCFKLPGGEAAIKEPRRAAIGLLYELFGEKVFEMDELAPLAACSQNELAAIRRMLARGINSPKTSSVGRLFDAVASILDLRHRVNFEGQAAMELEFAIDGVETSESYSLPLDGCVVDWGPMIHEILEDVRLKLPVSQISAKFHNALVEAIVAVAKLVGEERVVLTGGCFQNRYLTERAVLRLREEGFLPYWHQRVPPNDGGIALGQVLSCFQNC